MTDEQNRQNAEEYASTKEMHSPRSQDVELDKLMIIEDYIAGAHSRDEEIEQLKRALSSAQKAMAELAAMARSPWISVEQRLPPIKIRVLFLDKNGKVWLGRNTIAMQAELETDENNNLLPPPTVPPAKPVITHWMPIPKLKGGVTAKEFEKVNEMLKHIAG